MSSQELLKWHIRIFKLCALLPPEKPSTLHRFHLISFCIFIYIAFPLSELTSALFVKSTAAVVDRLILTSSNVLVATKSFNLLFKRKRFTEILRINNKLEETALQKERLNILSPIFKQSDFIFWFFGINYFGCWVFVFLQVLISGPELRIWSSTYFYPVEILHHPLIYFGGIVFQDIASFFHMSSIALDTYGASLIATLTGHITILCQRFQTMGHSTDRGAKYHEKQELIGLCERYILITKY